jgi:hypothetical protein
MTRGVLQGIIPHKQEVENLKFWMIYLKKSIFDFYLTQLKMNRKQLKLITLLLTAFVSLAFTSCKKDSLKDCEEHIVAPSSEDPLKTNLRIKNNSKYNICNFEIDPQFGKVNCGNIKKDETTCYRSFDTVFNYAYLHFFIGDKEFTVQPFDYVGEEPLGIGNFTYLIDIPDLETKQVSITVQKD